MVSGKQAKQTRAEIARKQAAKNRGFKLSTGWIIGIIAFLFFGGVIAFVAIDSAAKDAAREAVATDNTPANTVNDGFTVTAAGTETAAAYPATTGYTEQDVRDNNLTMYIDYDCPSCGKFEEANGQQIKEWLNDGTLDSVTIQPMAFVSQYSMQAFNALSCVADQNPDALYDTHMALMANQPGGTALSEDELTSLLENAGNPVGTEKFDACVTSEAYKPFIEAATARAQNGPLPAVNGENEKVTGTPTIFINGDRYSGDPTPEVLAQAVLTPAAGSNVGTIVPTSPAEE